LINRSLLEKGVDLFFGLDSIRADHDVGIDPECFGAHLAIL